jgi:hypothetical protein
MVIIRVDGMVEEPVSPQQMEISIIILGVVEELPISV